MPRSIERMCSHRVQRQAANHRAGQPSSARCQGCKTLKTAEKFVGTHSTFPGKVSRAQNRAQKPLRKACLAGRLGAECPRLGSSRKAATFQPSRRGVSMDASAHDLLFVGDRAAGRHTAIAAAELNPKLSIAPVSKVCRSGTAGVVYADDRMEEHIIRCHFSAVTGSVISGWLRHLSRKRP